MKKLFFGLLFLVVLIFVASVQLKNQGFVEVDYYFINEPFSVPVYVLLSVPFLIGLLLGVILMSFSVLKHKRRGSVEKKKFKKVEKEVENLRALPLKDEV